MDPSELPRRAEREVLCDTMLRLQRELRLYVTRDHAFPADLGFVTLGVYWGWIIGKPFSAHKLAMFLGVPRPTVISRLKWLIERGYIEKNGPLYHMGLSSFKPTSTIDKACQLIIDAGEKLQQLKQK